MPNRNTHDSYNEGARDERAAILRRVKRMQNPYGSLSNNLAALEEWIKTRKDRAAEKPGGIGRTKANARQ